MKYKQETKQEVFEGYVAYIASTFELYKHEEFEFDQVLSLVQFNAFVDLFREDPELMVNQIKDECESKGVNFEERLRMADNILKKHYPSAADD